MGLGKGKKKNPIKVAAAEWREQHGLGTDGGQWCDRALEAERRHV